MAEPMTVHLEIWPLAADETGLWLVSGDDALRPPVAVAADEAVDAEVRLALYAAFGTRTELPIVHGTSVRQDGPWLIVTHVAVLEIAPGALVLDRWADAAPISPSLVPAIGKPAAHDPARAPERIRHADVLVHAVRHLAFLRLYDRSAAEALPPLMIEHLAKWEPALAGLYDQPWPKAG